MKLYKQPLAKKEMNIYLKNIIITFLLTTLYFVLIEIMATVVIKTKDINGILAWTIAIISALMGTVTVFTVKRKTIAEHILSILVIAVTFYVLFYSLGILNNSIMGAEGVSIFVDVLNFSTIYYIGFCLISFSITSTLTIMKNIKNQDQDQLYW